MPEHSISWAGISSKDFGGVIVTASESNNRPRRKIDVEKVPGRNGDIIFLQDAWENIERSYEIVAGGRADGRAAAKFRDIASWLYSPIGYQELTDSSENGYFFQAYYAGGFDVENMLTRYGRAEITFNCRPERFLNSGKTMVNYNPASGTKMKLVNPTAFDAKPLICVFGSGAATIHVLDTAGFETNIYIGDIPGYGAYIDCENMDIISGSGDNLNSICRISGDLGVRFPRLTDGTDGEANVITWSGNGITGGYVIPNWWTI